MKSRVVGWDRFAAGLLGLMLIATGAAAIVWHLQLWDPMSGFIDVGPIRERMSEPWWPWVTGLIGVVLFLLALRWLFAHLPGSTPTGMTLDGTSDEGQLRADLSSVADAAAARVTELAGVRSANGSVVGERGERIIELTVTTEPGILLDRMSAAVDDIYRDLEHILGSDAPPVRTVVEVASSRQTAASRVR